MNRRNVLIGLGGLVAGGGALIGTGAFDTVEAQRTVSVETAGDASAFLGLSPAADVSDELVADPDDGTIEVVLNNTEAEGSGLNQNAVTTFNELVTVTNQGTQDVDQINLTIAHDDDGDIDGVFSYPVDGDADSPVANEGNILDEADTEPLTPGDAVTFGLIVDLLDNGADISELPENDAYTLTIEAIAAE